MLPPLRRYAWCAGLQGGGVAGGFISARPVAEGVPHEHLFDPLRSGQTLHVLDDVLHRAIQGRVADVGDQAGRFQRGASRHRAERLPFPVHILRRGLGVENQLRGAEAAEVVELFERVADVVHQSVALPAVLFLSHRHPLTEGLFRGEGQLGVHGDREVGHDPTQQSLPNPLAAADGVVVVAGRVGDEPRRLRQDAGALVGRQDHRLGVGKVLQPVRLIDAFPGRLVDLVLELLGVGRLLLLELG